MAGRKAELGEAAGCGVGTDSTLKKLKKNFSFALSTTAAMVLSSSSASAASLNDVLAELGVDPRVGLSAKDVGERAAAYGPNELAGEEDEPLWRKFLAKLREPMIALLLGSAGVSLLTGQYDDAVSIAIVRGRPLARAQRTGRAARR